MIRIAAKITRIKRSTIGGLAQCPCREHCTLLWERGDFCFLGSLHPVGIVEGKCWRITLRFLGWNSMPAMLLGHRSWSPWEATVRIEGAAGPALHASLHWESQRHLHSPTGIKSDSITPRKGCDRQKAISQANLCLGSLSGSLLCTNISLILPTTGTEAACERSLCGHAILPRCSLLLSLAQEEVLSEKECMLIFLYWELFDHQF